jgi:hypothetical protein
MNDVVHRLRQYDLTKTEALMIINLGIGLDRSQLPKVNGVSPVDTSSQQERDPDAKEIEDEGDPAAATTSSTVVPPEVANVEISESYHQYLLSRVVENMEERFQGEEGEQKIEQILKVLGECIPLADQHNE